MLKLDLSRPLPRPISVATLFLALVGLAMAIYLVTVRSSANLQSENSEEVSMAQASRKEAPTEAQGIISKPSAHSVEAARSGAGTASEYRRRRNIGGQGWGVPPGAWGFDARWSFR